MTPNELLNLLVGIDGDGAHPFLDALSQVRAALMGCDHSASVLTNRVVMTRQLRDAFTAAVIEAAGGGCTFQDALAKIDDHRYAQLRDAYTQQIRKLLG